MTRARSEEHTSELQSPIDISYAVFCLKKKKIHGSRVLGQRRQRTDLRRHHRRSDLRLADFFFFFNDTAPTEISTSIDTLSLHDALPISPARPLCQRRRGSRRPAQD